MAATVGEAGRVLDRGGRLCICVAHPVTDLGNFIDETANARFRVRRQYFETLRVEDTVHLDGLTMTFRGWTYSLEQYATALERDGLRIEALREPRATGSAKKYQRWRDIPLFLNLRAVKS